MAFVEWVRAEELGTGDYVLVEGEWKRVGPKGSSYFRCTEDGACIMEGDGPGRSYGVARIAAPLLDALRQGAGMGPYR